jgi:hypothetical protein
MQLVLRLIFLGVDIAINTFLLSSEQSITLGGIDFSNHLCIILFNAGMLLLIYIVDFILVKTQRYRTEIEIVEGLRKK